MATVAFGFGGDRWTTKDIFIDAPEYNRSIRTWGEHRLGGMYIALGLSMILVISTAISVYFCARGKPQVRLVSFLALRIADDRSSISEATSSMSWCVLVPVFGSVHDVVFGSL